MLLVLVTFAPLGGPWVQLLPSPPLGCSTRSNITRARPGTAAPPAPVWLECGTLRPARVPLLARVVAGGDAALPAALPFLPVLLLLGMLPAEPALLGLDGWLTVLFAAACAGPRAASKTACPLRGTDVELLPACDALALLEVLAPMLSKGVVVTLALNKPLLLSLWPELAAFKLVVLPELRLLLGCSAELAWPAHVPYLLLPVLLPKLPVAAAAC